MSHPDGIFAGIIWMAHAVASELSELSTIAVVDRAPTVIVRDLCVCVCAFASAFVST